MELNNNIEVAERDGVSRRVIVKSAAWSVPVFAAVGVTPAFAASSSVGINAGSLSGERGADNKTRTTVTFTWTTSTTAVNATVTSVTASASATGSTFSEATRTGTLGTPTFTFTYTHTNNGSTAIDIPTFTITATIIYTVPGNTTPQSVTESFSVSRKSGVAEGATNVGFDINPL